MHAILNAEKQQETLGVPVVSFADTDDFPAFYSRRSGFKVSLCYARIFRRDVSPRS